MSATLNENMGALKLMILRNPVSLNSLSAIEFDFKFC